MQQDNMGRLEALLFAAGEPLGVPQLAELLGLNKPQTWELLGSGTAGSGGRLAALHQGLPS